MRLFFTVLVVVVILTIGAAIGVLGRIWLDNQSQVTREAPAPAPAAAVIAPTSPPPPAATPSARDTVVEVSESEIQSQINTMLVGKSLGSTPLGDATIQSATVALRDRQIKVRGSAKAAVLNAPFTAAGTVTPDSNGRPLVRVDEATVGGVALPDAARTALADSFQTQVDGLFKNRSMKVLSIEIADGKMRVVGTPGS